MATRFNVVNDRKRDFDTRPFTAVKILTRFRPADICLTLSTALSAPSYPRWGSGGLARPIRSSSAPPSAGVEPPFSTGCVTDRSQASTRILRLPQRPTRAIGLSMQKRVQRAWRFRGARLGQPFSRRYLSEPKPSDFSSRHHARLCLCLPPAAGRRAYLVPRTQLLYEPQCVSHGSTLDCRRRDSPVSSACQRTVLSGVKPRARTRPCRGRIVAHRWYRDGFLHLG